MDKLTEMSRIFLGEVRVLLIRIEKKEKNPDDIRAQWELSFARDVAANRADRLQEIVCDPSEPLYNKLKEDTPRDLAKKDVDKIKSADKEI